MAAAPPPSDPAVAAFPGERGRRDWFQLEERHAGVMRARMATLAAVSLLGLVLGTALGGDGGRVAVACAVAAAAHAVLWLLPARAPARLRLCVDLAVVVDVVWASAVILAAGGVESRAVWLLLLVGLWSALGYSARTGVKSATLASLAYVWLVWIGADGLLTADGVGGLLLMWGLLAVAVAGAAAGETELRRRAERIEVLHDAAQRLLVTADADGARAVALRGAARLMPSWNPAWRDAAPGGSEAAPDDGRPRLGRDGETLELRIPVPGADGAPTGWIVLRRARRRGAPGRVRVRELVALEALAAGAGTALWRIALTAELHRHTITDQLTGLTNRRGYDAVLANLLAGLRREPQWVSLCLIDVDRFKVYNDTHGHQAGDGALRAVARTLAASVRPGDVAARYGGEEMVLVLPGAGPDDARAVAERARAAVEAAELEPARVTVSVGVASTRTPCTPEVLTEAADRCLYAAKEGGRNRVVVHPPLGEPDSVPLEAGGA